MSYIGGGMYYAETCPLCGNTLWNGVCENRDCDYHWIPKEDDPDNDDDNADQQQLRIDWHGNNPGQSSFIT